MAYDAFTGGIEPGGLRTTQEIRVLICYLLVSVGAPLSKEDILRIMQDSALANYFEITNALSELTENKTLTALPDGSYSATEAARMVSGQLDTALPISVRERAVSAALSLLAQARRERENQVEIEESEHGYNVSCHISGGDMELMRLTLYVPDLRQANLVKENFHRDPETVYRTLLAISTGDKDLVHDLLSAVDGAETVI